VDALILRNMIFVIGALILAAETGLKGAPTVRAHLPRFLASEIWNFVPLGLMAVAGVIWIYMGVTRTEPLMKIELPKVNSAAEESSTTPPSVADWRNRPSSPWAGPIGPIHAVELVSIFQRLPSPCVVKVTAPTDNENLRATLEWILQYGAKCEIASTPMVPPSADEPQFAEVQPNTKPGVIIHWAPDFSSGENIALFFDSSTYKVAISHRLPPNSNPHLVWIDIGPGSPWK